MMTVGELKESLKDVEDSYEIFGDDGNTFNTVKIILYPDPTHNYVTLSRDDS